jgi:plasmid stability protein
METGSILSRPTTVFPWPLREARSYAVFEFPLPGQGEGTKKKDKNMANLVVRHLDPRIVDALNLRAAKHGRSAEAEHRAILEEVLLPTAIKKSFAEALSAMPNVGQDADFERVEDPD